MQKLIHIRILNKSQLLRIQVKCNQMCNKIAIYQTACHMTRAWLRGVFKTTSWIQVHNSRKWTRNNQILTKLLSISLSVGTKIMHKLVQQIKNLRGLRVNKQNLRSYITTNFRILEWISSQKLAWSTPVAMFTQLIKLQ